MSTPVEPVPRVRILIGSVTGDYLAIEPSRREFPDATDYWDGNWLKTYIEIHVGTARRRYEALLRTEEFSGFRRGLTSFRESRRGVARFRPMEPWLSVTVCDDGDGQLLATCEARPKLSGWDALAFVAQIDMAQVEETIQALEEVQQLFPTVGCQQR